MGGLHGREGGINEMKKKTVKPKKKKSNNPNGRPQAKIDKLEVEKLARLGCNDTEIGDFFEVHPTTIGKRFSIILTKGRAARKAKLRQMQWKAAEAGNVAMLIWLGKQELGQTEKSEHIIPQLEDAIFKAEFQNGKIDITRTKESR